MRKCRINLNDKSRSKHLAAPCRLLIRIFVKERLKEMKIVRHYAYRLSSQNANWSPEDADLYRPTGLVPQRAVHTKAFG